MVWIDAQPARPIGKADIVVAPVASERPAAVPARRSAIVAAKAAPRENRPSNAGDGRGHLVDILA